MVSKPKKKKTIDKYEHINNAGTPSSSHLKEISILTPTNETEQSKGKNSTTAKKIKEERSRRNSTDENTPKASSKESKHNGKDTRLKKDKKKISPGGSEHAIPKIKFTLKRQDESWSATPAQNNENVTAQTATTNAILPNNVTTATQQNEHVKKVMAEFAQQGNSSDDEMMIASPERNDEIKVAQRTTPDEYLSSSISPLESNRGGGTSTKKKTRTQKSHNSNNKTKGNKDLDKKSVYSVCIVLSFNLISSMISNLGNREIDKNLCLDLLLIKILMSDVFLLGIVRRLLRVSTF